MSTTCWNDTRAWDGAEIACGAASRQQENSSDLELSKPGNCARISLAELQKREVQM
jgi:hypothetical protein